MDALIGLFVVVNKLYQDTTYNFPNESMLNVNGISYAIVELKAIPQPFGVCSRVNLLKYFDCYRLHIETLHVTAKTIKHVYYFVRSFF